MIFKKNKSTIRTVDNNLSITEIFDGKNYAFDFVIAKLDGSHPTVINKLSDRAYYILSGSGLITISGNDFEAVEGDLVIIRRGEPHSIKGKVEYIVITSPPFVPQNEVVL